MYGGNLVKGGSAPGRLLLACLLLACRLYPSGVLAMPASPHAFQVQQPDGTLVTLNIRGDEYFNWLEDPDGYTVIRSAGRYVYARLDGLGRLESAGLEVGKGLPATLGLTQRILPAPQVIDQQRAQMQSAGGAAAAPAAIAPGGVIKNLVVMIRFSNHATRTLPGSADFDVLFNAPGGDAVLAPTGSVRDVYLENSYGQLDLQSTPTGWINVSNTEAYYANGDSGLTARIWEALIEALDVADQSVNFSDYDSDNDGYIDSITFVHSGYGAEWGGTDVDGAAHTDRIWSHNWQIFPAWVSAEGVRVAGYNINPALWGLSGSAIGRVGVIAHETGHFLGLPDLYDTDNSSSGSGAWELMAYAWGFDHSQLYPPHLSAWSKIELGWVTPTVVSAPGTYTLLEVESNPDVVRIDNGFPAGEYLLLENRQPTGFDGLIPQGGIAIWHIDENKPDNDDEGYPGQAGWPGNNNHYMVAMLQADGNYQLEKGQNKGDAGDVYHAAGTAVVGAATVPSTDTYRDGVVAPTGIEIINVSNAAASMTFTLSGGSGQVPDPLFVYPTAGAIVPNGAPVDVIWNTNGAPVDPVFSDDMESGGGLWSVAHGTGARDWVLGTGNPRSGAHAWFADAPATVSDQYLLTAGPVLIPADGRIGFWHSYDTQAGFDGGVVEVSTDGAAWNDLGPRMTQNGYNGQLSSLTGSPVGGRQAFTGNSGGYVETLIDMSVYAGQNVYIRYRMATDNSVAGNGWYLDDASLYTPVTSYDLVYSDNCTPDILYSDDMESGGGLWNASHAAGTRDWLLGTVNPRSGTHAWFAEEPGGVTDQYLATAGPVQVAADGQISFWHSFDVESGYDGGVVEVSTDGTTWNDLGPWMTRNGYNGSISTSYSSPIGGRQAFTGNSGGYIETLIDMTAYADQSVYIRFRMTSDNSVARNGWYLDDAVLTGSGSAWVSIGATAPGASSYPWPVPAMTGTDYCIGITGKAAGYADSAQVTSGPFTVADIDTDGDGLSDSYETGVLGTSPASVDTDGDGLADGAGGVVPVAAYPAGVDLDEDGYVDGEQDLGTSPVLADTDGDGISDGDELALYGIDPLFNNLGDVAPRGAPDNAIDGGDLAVLARLASGAVADSALESVLADINLDSVIDGADLLLLRQAVIGGGAP